MVLLAPSYQGLSSGPGPAGHSLDHWATSVAPLSVPLCTRVDLKQKPGLELWQNRILAHCRSALSAAPPEELGQKRRLQSLLRVMISVLFPQHWLLLAPPERVCVPRVSRLDLGPAASPTPDPARLLVILLPRAQCPLCPHTLEE